MLLKKSYRRSIKNRKNGSLTEYVAVLGPLFIIFFFPMINLLSLCMTYFMCLALTNMQIETAAKFAYNIPVGNASYDATSDLASSIGSNSPLYTGWHNSMGKFCSPSVTTTCNLTLLSDATADYRVTVNNTISANPLLSIPIGINVPGINQPVTLSIADSRLAENVTTYSFGSRIGGSGP
jgi:hypothetical protein